MNPDDSINDDDILQELIADFLDAVNRGEQVDRAALLKEHPEYADSLRQFFSDHDRMASAASVDPVSPDPVTLPLNPNAGEQPTIPLVSADSDSDQQFKTSPDAGIKNPASTNERVRYFGDYELLSELARGGMGVVYRARQINLNRLVAVKMILSGQLASEEDVSRFYMEAEAAANLDHPGIVPIYEIGQHDGQHFFAMGFIEGQSLQQRIQDGPLPPREAAELTLKVAEAIHYAHEKGVIHRDLKPANILLDADGQPRVTDFGLAKKSTEDSGLTATGQILGTPAYMPPEQAVGKTELVGPHADIYSLGAVLYCLITGRPPFQAASPMDTILQVLEQQPLAPRTLNSQVPEDLNTICLKCLEKDPHMRYDSASKMGDDLSRYLLGEPILAKPPSIFRLVRYWISENVGAIGWAAAIGVLVGLMFAWVTLQTDVTMFLHGIGNSLDALGFPQQHQPTLTHLPTTPLWLKGILQAILLILLVTAGFFIALLVRPKNRPADVIAGGLAGFCAAGVLFLLCFSWLLPYREMAAVSRDLAEIARADSAGQISQGLIERYPGLNAAIDGTQMQVAGNLVEYRLIVSSASGIGKAVLLSSLVCIPPLLLETMLAGSLLRRSRTRRIALFRYLEIGIPAAMILAIFSMLHMLVMLGLVQTTTPTYLSLLLYIPLIAAVIASLKSADWRLRTVLHLVWIAAFVAGLIIQWGDSTRTTDLKRPILGVSAVDSPDQCEIADVLPNSPASRAGLRKGDIISALDGIAITSFHQLRENLKDKSNGELVILSIRREDEMITVEVEL